MAEPRRIVANQTYFITRRCSHRAFRLRPDNKVSQIYLYALGWAAQKTGVEICSVVVMSNHVHMVINDPYGEVPNFMRELHRTVAKAVNAYHKVREGLWSNEKTSLLPIADDGAMIDRIAYTATNPVSAGLVDRPDKWPGILLWRPGRMTIKRPDVYFDPKGPFPEKVELRIVRPPKPQMGEAMMEKVLSAIIEGRVRRKRQKMANQKRRFLGRRAILATSIEQRATSPEPMRMRHPKVAATTCEAYELMMDVRSMFLMKYEAALKLWRQGVRTVTFPEGTWWMARHHHATVSEVSEVSMEAG